MSENQKIEDFNPVANDVIVQFDHGMWEARHYAKGEVPKLIFRHISHSIVRRKGSDYAKQFASKVYTRMKGGNIILDDKDNQHNVNAVAEGGIEEEPGLSLGQLSLQEVSK